MAWAKYFSAITWNSELSGACAAMRHSSGAKPLHAPAPNPVSARGRMVGPRRMRRDQDALAAGTGGTKYSLASVRGGWTEKVFVGTGWLSKVSDTVSGFTSPLVTSKSVKLTRSPGRWARTRSEAWRADKMASPSIA